MVCDPQGGRGSQGQFLPIGLFGHSPLQLLLVLLLPGLGLHLLHLDGVGLPAAHVQLMVPHAKLQDPLVDSQAWGIEHEVLQNRTGWPG